MNIGVDIDGVVSNTFPLMVKELNSFFGISIKSEDIDNYDIRKIYKVIKIHCPNLLPAVFPGKKPIN